MELEKNGTKLALFGLLITYLGFILTLAISLDLPVYINLTLSHYK